MNTHLQFQSKTTKADEERLFNTVNEIKQMTVDFECMVLDIEKMNALYFYLLLQGLLSQV